MRSPAAPALLLAVALVMASPTRAAESGATLTVPGRSSQTHWAAALGPFVAVAWGAHVPDGRSDVFVAVSRDGGRQFHAPVRVNDIEGEARLGGELPPRVALVPRSGGDVPEIVIAYGSKTRSTAIKVSRSTDGGRTFRPGRALHAAAAGDRGWHALTIDAAGALVTPGWVDVQPAMRSAPAMRTMSITPTGLPFIFNNK